MLSLRNRLAFSFIVAGIILVAAPTVSRAQPLKEGDLVERIRDALETGNLDQQKAVLTLIPEAGLRDRAAIATATNLESYLQKTSDEDCRALALLAYGKLNPPVGAAARVLKTYLQTESPKVRRAAASALAQVVSATCVAFGRPSIMIMGNPSPMILGHPESAGLIGGSATALAWSRGFMKSLENEDMYFIPFAERCKQLLPLCGIALNDADDVVRAGGAEGIRLVGSSIADALPDPAASSYNQTRAVDPLDAKVKWLLLEPALKSLNEAAVTLPKGIRSPREGTRLVSVRAAEAVAMARDLALATRRAQPDNLPLLVSVIPAEDPLYGSVLEALPAVTEALQDPSPTIRLTAIEAFENVGPAGRLRLPAVIQAAQNDDLFVRWVATRTLGRMYSGANADDNRLITTALRERVDDVDLDVATSALIALGKGGSAARDATDVVVRRSAHGDPDTCILAIRTLELIDAEPKAATTGLINALRSDSARIRRAAVVYLGKKGTAARAAIPVIRKLVSDDDEEVRKEAAKALLLIEKGL